MRIASVVSKDPKSPDEHPRNLPERAAALRALAGLDLGFGIPEPLSPGGAQHAGDVPFLLLTRIPGELLDAHVLNDAQVTDIVAAQYATSLAELARADTRRDDTRGSAADTARPLAAVRAIRGTFPLQQALYAIRDGDEDELATGLADYNALQVDLGARDPGAMLHSVQDADDAWADGDQWVYGTWAQVRIGAALAHVMTGEPDGAAAELAPVFDLGAEYRVVTIIGRMAEVGRRLGHARYKGDRRAADLAERIRAFQAGSLEHKALTAPGIP